MQVSFDRQSKKPRLQPLLKRRVPAEITTMSFLI